MKARRYAAAIACVLAVHAAAAAADEGGPPAAWAGLYAGQGRLDARMVDVDGFANWGRPGWRTGYRDAAAAGGALAGRRFEIGGVRLRVEVEGGVSGAAAKSDLLDPAGRDETAETKLRWLAALRAGVEHAFGGATLFATAGPAAARIETSVTDLDRGLAADGRPTPWRFDPDDSFRDERTRFGWAAGAGVETALSDAWSLRFEGAYFDFGTRTHEVNRSGAGACGSGGPRRPCPYRAETRFGLLRLAIVHRFAL